ncbi:MAG: arylsulfatase A-like enzyme [Bacteroidia bacterium]|jgi:arylsulfatase A-like enzyme
MNRRGGGKASKDGIAAEDSKRIFEVTERSINFMQEQVAPGKPFYLQASHYAVHLSIYFREQTLAQTKQWEIGQKHNMPGFAAMTTDLDTGVGLVVEAAEALGIMDNTYIIFMSDNDGRTQVPGQTESELTRNYPLRGGKQSLYEGGVRVAFGCLSLLSRRALAAEYPSLAPIFCPRWQTLQATQKPCQAILTVAA